MQEEPFEGEESPLQWPTLPHSSSVSKYMKCVRLLSVHNRTRCYTFPKKFLLSLLTTGCGGHRKSGKATMNFTQKRGGGLVHFITSMDAGASQLTASAVHEIACLSTADEA